MGAGTYVLSWRWDCEETDQVWNSCADIVITDGPVPAPIPPAPTPSPAPSPSPSGSCDGFKPDAVSYACYYKGCITKDAKGNCEECCSGCHLETYTGKGTYCMEDKEVVCVESWKCGLTLPSFFWNQDSTRIWLGARSCVIMCS